jgi:hypothetical protein
MWNSAPILFASDLFHQILFYFGGVVAMGILLWEKKYEKPIHWRIIFSLFLCCLFVSCFQAWLDEHNNSQLLIEQKASLTSQVNGQRARISWLTDHQQIHVEASPIDPDLSKLLARLSSENSSLKSEPHKDLKKSLVDLTAELVQFYESEKRMTDGAESRSMAHRFADGASPPTSEWRLQQQADEQMVLQTETNVDADVRNKMLSDYGPRVLSVLDQIHSRGGAIFGVSEAEIQDATFMCSSVSATNQLRLCISQLGVIVQKMR